MARSNIGFLLAAAALAASGPRSAGADYILRRTLPEPDPIWPPSPEPEIPERQRRAAEESARRIAAAQAKRDRKASRKAALRTQAPAGAEEER